MTHADSPNDSGPRRPTTTPMDPSILTGKLQSLTAAERSRMEQAIAEYGEAYVTAQWGTLIGQLRYIDTL